MEDEAVKSVTYIGRRTGEGTEVIVNSGDGEEWALEHRVLHSPTGMNWGYGGSGPADLARSVLAHHLGGIVPSAGIYQAFKFRVIAGLAGDEWRLTSEQIQSALDQVLEDRGVVCAVCGDSGWLWREQTADGEERPCECPRGFEEAAAETESFPTDL